MERVKPELRKTVISNIMKLIYQSETVESFAQSIGVSRDTVNNWTRGRSDIRLNDLVNIAQVYGKSVDSLLGLIPESNYSTDATTRMVSEHTGLSTEAVNALHGNTSDIERGGITVTVSCVPTQERRVIEALLTTPSGKEMLKDLYSFLFNNYDVFIMHGKDKDGKDATLQSDTITMHGSDLPVYVVHPDDVRDMIARKIYRNLSELQREADKMEGE